VSVGFQSHGAQLNGANYLTWQSVLMPLQRPFTLNLLRNPNPYVLRLRVTDFQIVKELLMHLMHQFISPVDSFLC